MGKRFKKSQDRKSFDSKSSEETRGQASQSRSDVKPPKVCLNDPEWYVPTKELREGVGRLAFDEWLGRGFVINAATATNIHQTTVVALPYYPTFGYSTSDQSAINLAIRNIYTFVRHANSGSKNYESPDLGMYLMATGVAIAYAAHLERILGVVKYFKTRNAVCPNGLIDALGITDYADLRKHIANYTTELNEQWLRLQSLCIPAGMSFIKRWIWMNSQVFKDHMSSKAGMYVFRPIPTFFSATKLPTGGCLYSDATYETGKFSDLIDSLTTMVDNILGNSDMRTISGDILKAYGADGVLKLGQTSLDYMVEPMFVEEMLPQIQNCHTLPGETDAVLPGIVSAIPLSVASTLSSSDAAAIQAEFAAHTGSLYHYQSGDSMICVLSVGLAGDTPTWSSSTKVFGYTTTAFKLPHRIFNSFAEDPSSDDVLVASRLTFNAKEDGCYIVCDFATEIVRNLEVHYVTENELAVTKLASTFIRASYSNLCFDLLQLDYSPICYAHASGGPNWNLDMTANIQFVCGDFDNYTIIDDSFIRRINNVAVYGEFNAPGLNYRDSSRLSNK